MTSSEIVRLDDEHAVAPFAQAPLAVQMDYARAVSTANLLPQAYRNKPADIMLVVGLGSAMGLSPAESLYRIDVIQGKPTASAELIAANVRKAGHRLRVTGGDQSCTATILRSDDPDFEFTITRDVKWAQAMGLTGKDNYKKQPGTMLQWRAITAVARLACPEALYGVAYTADEMGDMPHAPDRGGLAAALADDDAPAPEPPIEETGEVMQDKTRAQMFALFNERDIKDADAQRAGIAQVIGRDVESRGELTEAEAQSVIASLRGTGS